ncbi:MAG TPA: PIN domain-containing protein [Candidatus Polarisedimenticolaceae bacterium]|nr:PIN domain-containing protein [Candidatus Polarisedimenticolaceae bacterium]
MAGRVGPILVRLLAPAIALAVLLAFLGVLPLSTTVALALGTAIALSAEAYLASRAASGSGAPESGRPREALVDTSALIDGRLADLAETGFLSIDLVVPEFVLRELQHVADAADSMRRARGRRGLDVLQTLRGSKGVRVRVVVDDLPNEPEVDLKLVGIAKRRGAALVTTDFNLNKVAGIRGVRVLNVNDLAHALRPVVLPGETLRVTVVKEGKEAGQGVAYLADGTMVVVEQGRDLVGRSVGVLVTSAIQTAAGKMYFAKRVE